MSISFELDAEQSRRLQALAEQLQVDPAELAIAAVNELVTKPADDFAQAAKQVLEKNRELYRRLSGCDISHSLKYWNCTSESLRNLVGLPGIRDLGSVVSAVAQPQMMFNQ